MHPITSLFASILLLPAIKSSSTTTTASTIFSSDIIQECHQRQRQQQKFQSSRMIIASWVSPSSQPIITSTRSTTRRRQRRRRYLGDSCHDTIKVSFAAVQGDDDGHEKTNVKRRNEDSNNSRSKTSGGGPPYSMKFERYRIPLSRHHRSTDDTQGTMTIPFWTNLKGRMDRSWFERNYSQTSSRVQWKEFSGVDDDGGSHVAASFWRTVATMSSSSTKEQTVIVGFGGGVPMWMIRNLIEINDWMMDRMEQDDSNELGVVRATMEEDAPFPVIVLTCSSPEEDRKTTTMSHPHESSSSSSGLLVEERLRAWVRRLLVGLGICPFTKSDRSSGQGLADVGVPVGRIRYCYSPVSKGDVSGLMADIWEAISEMISAGPSGKNGISSILLAAPSFDDDFPLWAGPIFTILEATVTAVTAESQIGVVCFHPEYATPDGTSWPGFGHMHSVPRLRQWLEEHHSKEEELLKEEEVAAGGAWQRRTPHAVVNVLRADQLEKAEGRRQTGELYARNLEVLVGKRCGIGSTRLAADLIKEQMIGTNDE